MFNKLKRKFIIINMSLLTLVFICIFSSIYFFSLNNSNKQINASLHAMLYEPNNGRKPGGFQPGQGGGNLLGIVIDLDSSNNIRELICPYDANRSVFIEATPMLLALKEDKGVVEIDNTSYAYLKSSAPINKIVLIDRSNHLYNLRNLLKTFIITSTLSLSLLFIVSWYFANKSVKPIIEAFNKQKQFIADASHELRTPVAIIKTNLDLLNANKYETIQSQEKWLHYIQDQTDRMTYLIDDMLSLAKLDSENITLELEPVNVNKIIENLLMSFEAVFFENKILLDEAFESNLIIKGSVEELKKLFNILIDNAIKHTPINGKITINLRRIKNKGEITITNTGEGIEKEHLEKIFERFYRADNSRQRKSGGYGLGLAIAASIVKQHGGHIYAKSNLKVNTSFIIEVPLYNT